MKRLVQLLCLIVVFSGGVFADNLSLQPSTTTPALGNSVTVDVIITGVSDLYAFQFDIDFNPAVLSATGVVEGSLFGSIGVFFSPGFIDNTAGTITFIGDSLSGPGPGVNIDGILATLTFEAIGVGSSSIDLANILLLDSNLFDIPLDASGTAVTVASSAVPEPGSWVLLGAVVVMLVVWGGKKGLRANRSYQG
ncbi:MAG: cohesin domain-containing protein [Candidatus Solibacter sp.]|nr:cohesin domain-containing protein [Candidatus Solibacter sp.]